MRRSHFGRKAEGTACAKALGQDQLACWRKSEGRVAAAK